MVRGMWIALALVVALGLGAAAASFDFYRAGANAVGLFNNLTGDTVDELVLRFTGPIEPMTAVGIGANMELMSNAGGELRYAGTVAVKGTWEVDWAWEGPRLEYAAWLRGGELVEEIAVHDPTAAFGMIGRYAGQRIRFFAPASADPDGEPLVRYLWSWSDGAVAEGVTAERVFSAGEYWVKLTVWDADGNEASRLGQFQIRGCQLTVSVEGCGLVGKQPDLTAYTYGQEVTLDPLQCAHWDFIGWSGDLSGTATPATVRVLGDTEITAHFSQHPYTVVTNIVGDGTATREPDQITYFYGDNVTLTAVPSLHWDFVDWSGDIQTASNPVTFDVTGDMALTATFALHDYILTLTSAGNGSVAVTPDGATVGADQTRTFYYHYGDVVGLDAQAAEHWRFVEWTGDVPPHSGDPVTVTIEGDATISALFNELYLIAFQDTGAGSTWDVFVVREDGSDLQNLTQSTAQDKYPNWSLDGGSVAFISTREGGTWKPYVMRADGTGLLRLADMTAVDVTWGGSDLLAFINAPDNGSGSIWTVHADGTGLTRITSGLSFYNIAVSQDGERISGYVPGSGLYAMDADGSDLRRYSTNEGYGIAWSPDGRYIAHVFDNGLYVYDYETGENRLVTTATALGVPSLLSTSMVDWSASGLAVAFEAGQASGLYDIWTVNIDGSDARRITSDPLREASDGWSPDGQRLLYVHQSSPAGFRVVDLASGVAAYDYTMIAGSAWYHTYPVWQHESL